MRVGNKQIKSLYVGNKPVKAIYLGSKKVWARDAGKRSITVYVIDKTAHLQMDDPNVEIFFQESDYQEMYFNPQTFEIDSSDYVTGMDVKVINNNGYSYKYKVNCNGQIQTAVAPPYNYDVVYLYFDETTGKSSTYHIEIMDN